MVDSSLVAVSLSQTRADYTPRSEVVKGVQPHFWGGEQISEEYRKAFGKRLRALRGSESRPEFASPAPGIKKIKGLGAKPDPFRFAVGRESVPPGVLYRAATISTLPGNRHGGQSLGTALRGA